MYDTFRVFMQEQERDNITDRSALYLDYRPYIRQICQSEQIRASESYSRGRYIFVRYVLKRLCEYIFSLILVFGTV